ncbi:putative Immunoglobulin V-set domain-containing protein 3, partial [Homarus americanus]
LRVTKVEVPRVVVVGDSATLRCHFALHGEVLYSLKWWKDGRQFYQFIPRNKPKMAVFTTPGLSVNVARSGLHQVELVDLYTSSSGLYRCEVVGEAPTFTTHVRAANMTVV